MGGYDDKLNEKNEKKYQAIYEYNHMLKKLEKRGDMLNLRYHFGICTCGDFIYIIGGKNYREGALIKCEKFNIKTGESQPINFLHT